MVKKLKKKLILVTILVLFFVFFTVVATINIVNYQNVCDNADEIIEFIAINNGKLPYQRPGSGFDGIHGEVPFSARYFTVTIVNDQVIDINLDRVALINEEQALNIAQELYSKQSVKGFYSDYKYQLVIVNNTLMYIFLDCAMELDSFYNFLWASILISLLGLIVISILVFIFSGIVTRPISESYEKQKEFITNVNHEIKTPLSIVKATNEVIELENGKNEWTDIINTQITKLTDLTEKLVFLSRMDENKYHFVSSEFNLSQTAYEVSEPFIIYAQTNGKTLDVDIEPNMMINGEVSLIGQLISILLDNAIKYSSDSSVISLKVYTHHKNKIINVTNEVEGLKPGRYDYMFERFYRGKNVNSKGSGIGLSIAKTIVNYHKGKIQASSLDGKTIEFVVTI